MAATELWALRTQKGVGHDPHVQHLTGVLG